MELRNKDEYGRYSTVEPTVTAYFTRAQLVEQIADLAEKLEKNRSILAMIDVMEAGKVAIFAATSKTITSIVQE